MFTLGASSASSSILSASPSSSSFSSSSRFCCRWQKRKTLPFVLPPPELPQKKNGTVMNQSKGRLPILVVARGWRDDSPIAPREGAKTKKKSTKNKKKKKNFETGKKGSAASASFKTIDLGRGKTVEIFCDDEAENVGDVDFAASAEEGISLAQLNGNLYGAGDVIWPSSEALARLVAHVPSLVKNKDCIDIGAGLGLVSAAAIMSQAKRVLAVDYDAEVLEMTMKSVEKMVKMVSSVSSSDSANGIDFNGAEVKQLDWTCVDGEWPKHEFDVALASDVLYDENCAQCVANVIDRVLKKKTANVDDESNISALLCDPAHRPNREKFSEMCDKLGLEAIDAEYPGDKNMRLVQVLRR
jgi:predicted nicotinamide N-methyase